MRENENECHEIEISNSNNNSNKSNISSINVNNTNYENEIAVVPRKRGRPPKQSIESNDSAAIVSLPRKHWKEKSWKKIKNQNVKKKETIPEVNWDENEDIDSKVISKSKQFNRILPVKSKWSEIVGYYQQKGDYATLW